MRSETLDCNIDYIACLDVGSLGRRPLHFSRPYLPHPFLDAVANPRARFNGFRSVSDQDPVEERDLRGHLDHFASFSVVRALRRTYQQP